MGNIGIFKTIFAIERVGSKIKLSIFIEIIIRSKIGFKQINILKILIQFTSFIK